MAFDFTLFDIINGLAGHWALLDLAGRLIAIYGLLAALVIAAGVFWWPWYEAAERRAYLRSIIVAGLMIAALIGLEVLLARVLHHELRARPYNGRWVTLLVTEVSHMSFPAWPVAVVMAVAVPLLTMARKIAVAVMGIGILLAFALVFVGVNFPLDVMTGALLGAVIGYTAWLLVKGMPSSESKIPWRKAGVMWVTVLAWSLILLAAISPASTADHLGGDSSEKTEFKVYIPVPPLVSQRAQLAAAPDTVEMSAATNKHIIVARAHVMLVNPSASLVEIETMARKVCNASFASWPQLNLLTIDVAASIGAGDKAKTGTQYSVTIDRTAFSPGGFTANAQLPGKKFFHSRFYAR